MKPLVRIRPGFALAALVLVGLALLAMLAAPPTSHAQTTGYTDVSAGHLFTCALKDNGDVTCWGLNLFDEAPALVTGPFTKVSAGGWVGCGLKTDQTIACWGDEGDPGEGATTPPGGAFSQISAGWNHSCALRTNKTVDCWGNYGQDWAADPSGTYLQVSAGMQHTCAVDSITLNAHCWGDNKDGRAQDYPGPFKQISAGGYHNCGVKTDNTVVCWGRNDYGQATPPPGAHFTEVAAGQMHTCGIKTDRSIACWGYNLYGEVGKAPATGTWKQITSGLGHSCAIGDNNYLNCWGRNDWGQANDGPKVGSPLPGFAWKGFEPPVQALPTVNPVQAGSAVPLKFGLGGDKGLKIFADGFPASMQVDCTSREPAGVGAATKTAGGSSLSYDPASGRYSYVWKTDKGWAGTCRILVLKLADDTWHVAGFRFR